MCNSFVKTYCWAIKINQRYSNYVATQRSGSGYPKYYPHLDKKKTKDKACTTHGNGQPDS